MASLVCWNQHDQSATACMAHHDRIGAMLAATRKALGSDAPMLFVCMLQGSWGPALDLSKVLMAVRQLLAEPNPKDPLVVDIVRDSNCMACRWMQALLCPYRLTQHQQPTYADATNLQPAYPMIAWSNKSPVAFAAFMPGYLRFASNADVVTDVLACHVHTCLLAGRGVRQPT
jgi:hypothetical protein